MKNKYFFFFIFSLSTLCAYPQKQDSNPNSLNHPSDTKKNKAFFNPIFIGKVCSENVSKQLISFLDNNHPQNFGLVLTDSLSSKTGKHFRYAQTYKGVPVFRSEIKVNCNNKGYITSVFTNTFTTSTIPPAIFPSEEITTQFLSTKANFEIIKIENVYFYQKEKLIPCVRIELIQDYNYNYETIIDVTGSVIYQRNLGNYAAPVDSVVTALVFNPDPLTIANVVYGTPYVDSNDSDVPQLNAQRVTKNLTVQYSGDTFYLKNNFVQIKNFDPPNIAPAYTVSTPAFSYTRSQDGFEDVNAFYHITEFQKHIQALGFNNLVNYPIEVDAHAMNGNDNSQFIPSTKRLYFGEGGVDDAEDADVVIHEYGHAILHSAAPNTNNGLQRQALDEALGDYLASSYSRHINNYKWENVFSWDGHNTFWSGRISNSNKLYPTDLISNIYSDAEIWSSVLMEIWGDIGRNKTDEILFESLYGYASNMTMADAALLFIQADSNLYSGQHYTSICNRFLNRGLVSSCIVSIPEYKTAAPFTVNPNILSDESDITINLQKNTSGTIKIYDIQGRVVFTEALYQSQSITLNRNSFKSGIYIISLQTETNVYNTKFIRQ